MYSILFLRKIKMIVEIIEIWSQFLSNLFLQLK